MDPQTKVLIALLAVWTIILIVLGAISGFYFSHHTLLCDDSITLSDSSSADRRDTF